MDYRDKVYNDILSLKQKNLLLLLPTGFGKTKLALDIMAKRCKVGDSILIVIPKNVLKQNWADEFNKWGYQDYLPFVTFTTYLSFPKHAGEWAAVIMDEAHHLTERCRDALYSYTIHNNIMLSATVGKDMRYELRAYFPDLYIYKVNARTAIDRDVLPDPMVYLIPLTLDNTKKNCEIIKNKSKGNPVYIEYKDRWSYNSIKNQKIIIRCTQQEWYNDINSLISYYENRIYNEIFKNKYLHAAGERLKWLSNQKTEFVKIILSYLTEERTLTFCNSIEQTEQLGKYCINSKNKDSAANLEAFNDNKIDHITACSILDEGVNLVNCRIGVYANLNASNRMIQQRLGRLLRHPNPILIIPYFRNTRDEQIVNKMRENYNPQLVHVIHNINEIEL